MALFVMDGDSVYLSWYLSVLILGPFIIVLVIIMDIVYKWKFKDLDDVGKATLEHRWLQTELEMVMHPIQRVTSRKSVQEQIGSAQTVHQLMPFLERIDIEDLKAMLIKHYDKTINNTLNGDGYGTDDVAPQGERLIIVTSGPITPGENGDEDSVKPIATQPYHVGRKESKPSFSFSSTPISQGHGNDVYDNTQQNEKEYDGDDQPKLVKESNPVSVKDVDMIVSLSNQLDQYLEYKSGAKGKGIVIERMKRNEYGKELEKTYGFNNSVANDNEEWFIVNIDGHDIDNKGSNDIDDILKQLYMCVNSSAYQYQVTFKKDKKL
eukprot:143129_1